MGASMTESLESRIMQLDEEGMKHLEMFIDFLLEKQQPKKRTQISRTSKSALLGKLEEIPISGDSRFLDRNLIYADRI